MDRDTSCIVLCGGTSRRFGGGDKTAATFGEATVLDHLLDRLPPQLPIICAGDHRPTRRAVTWVREDPPLGGPVAGIAAALEHVTTPLVAVIAGDMPYAALALPTLRSALTSAPDMDGAVAVDPDGRHQPLLAIHRSAALRAVLPARPGGMPARRVLGGLRTVRVPVGDRASADVDTPTDLARLLRSSLAPIPHGHAREDRRKD